MCFSDELYEQTLILLQICPRVNKYELDKVGLFLIAFSLQLWMFFLYSMPKLNKLFPICWLQCIKPYQQALHTDPLNSFLYRF